MSMEEITRGLAGHRKPNSDAAVKIKVFFNALIFKILKDINMISIWFEFVFNFIIVFSNYTLKKIRWNESEFKNSKIFLHIIRFMEILICAKPVLSALHMLTALTYKAITRKYVISITSLKMKTKRQ